MEHAANERIRAMLPKPARPQSAFIGTYNGAFVVTSALPTYHNPKEFVGRNKGMEVMSQQQRRQLIQRRVEAIGKGSSHDLIPARHSAHREALVAAAVNGMLSKIKSVDGASEVFDPSQPAQPKSDKLERLGGMIEVRAKLTLVARQGS
jgi:hypothetical protein